MVGIAFVVIFVFQGLINYSVDSEKVSRGLLNLFPEFNSTEIRFLLWTRGAHSDDSNYTIIKYSDLDDLQGSPFDGSKKTYIHFHGFTNNGTMKWILTSKTNILSVEDANVISVDYGALVPLPTTNYYNSVKIMYSVAEHVASFMDWLIKETTLTASLLHFIGHSLGAHAAGITAKNMKLGIVERITGLDPAGPKFEYVSSKLRLDRSQAKFVDIIHTNACIVGSLACRGIYQEIGHVDFYPNGGLMQPGCKDILCDVECSHQRVTDFWNESIKPVQFKFTSWPCENSLQYITNSCTSCGSGCLDMGFYLNTSLTGSYYLSTFASSPYAKGDEQF